MHTNQNYNHTELFVLNSKALTSMIFKREIEKENNYSSSTLLDFIHNPLKLLFAEFYMRNKFLIMRIFVLTADKNEWETTNSVFKLRFL